MQLHVILNLASFALLVDLVWCAQYTIDLNYQGLEAVIDVQESSNEYETRPINWSKYYMKLKAEVQEHRQLRESYVLWPDAEDKPMELEIAAGSDSRTGRVYKMTSKLLEAFADVFAVADEYKWRGGFEGVILDTSQGSGDKAAFKAIFVPRMCSVSTKERDINENHLNAIYVDVIPKLEQDLRSGDYLIFVGNPTHPFFYGTQTAARVPHSVEVKATDLPFDGPLPGNVPESIVPTVWPPPQASFAKRLGLSLSNRYRRLVLITMSYDGASTNFIIDLIRNGNSPNKRTPIKVVNIGHSSLLSANFVRPRRVREQTFIELADPEIVSDFYDAKFGRIGPCYPWQYWHVPTQALWSPEKDTKVNLINKINEYGLSVPI
ncbi:MAG: hypothetical protein M1833_003120 [Piccolia ochrophora]|nr:MAG: hypothetical protein M1833_003120 [Piccolia ochrophora]